MIFNTHILILRVFTLKQTSKHAGVMNLNELLLLPHVRKTKWIRNIKTEVNMN